MLSLNKFLIPASVVTSLVLAACGSSSQKSTSSSSAASSPPPASQPASSGLTIGTAKGSVGTYLTGASGRALYIWVADSNGKSSCSGACAKAWPPLTAGSIPQVADGVHAASLSLISRSGGIKQVAYMGRPLYYYVGDTSAGSTSGNGSDQFGAKWWLISPSGGEVTNAPSSSSSTAPSSSSSTAPSSSSSGGSSSSSSGGGWG
jgi:predicted lipoprotein with Yx(FWY)xxD motif